MSTMHARSHSGPRATHMRQTRWSSRLRSATAKNARNMCKCSAYVARCVQALHSKVSRSTNLTCSVHNVFVD